MSKYYGRNSTRVGVVVSSEHSKSILVEGATLSFYSIYSPLIINHIIGLNNLKLSNPITNFFHVNFRHTAKRMPKCRYDCAKATNGRS